jgi:nucleoside-diphosphate-sugar epimerase
VKKILVTGASGFIGKALCNRLFKSHYITYGVVRNSSAQLIDNKFNKILINEINSNTNWKNILNNINCIVHCAGIAHNMNKNNNLNFYRSTNLDGTKYLAEQAAEAGVKKLIFLSSIKVNGEYTDDKYDKSISSYQKKNSFTHVDPPNPTDPYSISKLEAEKVLYEIYAKTGLETVILRLPLVYGKNVKGNLARLIRLVKSGIPLPFGNIANQRSMIGIDNLVDLLIHCIEHQNAAGKTFLVSDGEDLSTSDLIKLISSLMGKKARLFSLPIILLKFVAIIFRKEQEINRLIRSLRVDHTYTQKILNWKPPVTVEEGIRRMIQDK